MTPSEAHDTAWKRDVGHDQMTIECRNLLEKRWARFSWRVEKDRREPHSLTGIWCEHFFVCEKGPRFFADIFAKWECEYESVHADHTSRGPVKRITAHSHAVYVAFEIKPQIHSAGALLRQVRVQRERLSTWLGYKANTEIFVWPLVPADDPLLEIYIEMSGMSAITWDKSKQQITFRNPR
jgi:hypothetical protein